MLRRNSSCPAEVAAIECFSGGGSGVELAVKILLKIDVRRISLLGRIHTLARAINRFSYYNDGNVAMMILKSMLFCYTLVEMMKHSV